MLEKLLEKFQETIDCLEAVGAGRRLDWQTVVEDAKTALAEYRTNAPAPVLELERYAGGFFYRPLDAAKSLPEGTFRLYAETSPDPVQLVQARRALAPFAEVGSFLFARPLPDDTPMVDLQGLNGQVGNLTRGDFKFAHQARIALMGNQVAITTAWPPCAGAAKPQSADAGKGGAQ